jgi:hypothetical protein
MTEERRKSPRTYVDQIAFISVAGSSTRCRIINISDAGAAIGVPEASHIPICFQLMTESDRVIRNCRIAWIKLNMIGVEFEDVQEQPDRITHPQRQFLQYLRDAGWRRSVNLPDSPKVITKLLRKGWIERGGNGSDVAYRITPQGLAAKTTPVKM